MQNVDTTENNDAPKEIKTVEIDQTTQTSAMTGPSLIENAQVPTSQSTFGLDVSCSDDDEVSEVDSFILDTEDADPALEPSFLLPQSMEGANLQTVTVDPETHARLEALLEAAGIGKLSTADGKALTDPEVLRKLTSSVSCALDEAAQALHRMRAEQQLGTIDTSRSLAEACSDGDVPTVRKLLREGGSVHETTEEGDSLLSLACSAGYYELAQVLLAMKANVEDRGIKGDCTPLMEAASGGYVDIVKLLISHGADVNAQSSAGNTPLHYGACGGYMDVVQVLIEAGANVEQHNENGHTPLMEAASAGHVTVASILLQAGAGINTHSNEFKESALTLACYKGHLDMVKFLLEAGADQEHKTDEMHTALMEASMDGHVEVAKLLLDSGAQVNMPADSFESPLTLAACGGHVELALLLIERGANLEEVNDEGYTPLMEAAREGHEEMVALLLAHDADINAQTEETQETALTLACCGGFLDVADFLITAGADIELGCSTPLMEAAQEGHLELVKYLLKAKANVQAQTGTGDTALTYACENGHTDVAEVLLQHGAVLEHESEGGRTPLMKAARAGHLCTVQFLISKGADVNRQTSTNDHTVLSLACAGGHLAVVELLLAQGADPAHKLKDGSTMVIEAAKGGHTQVVKLLLEYPNRMLMNTQQDLPQVTANDSHLVESRVPIHGLANIVPPSEPDSHPAKPNNLTTCEHTETTGVKRKASVAEMNIPIKPNDQILQNMQKSLAKKSTGTGNSQQADNKSNKNINVPNSGDVSPQVMENGELPDIMSEETIDLKATERLEAIISNVMAKELINTTSTREEQILRKQQILEELQKVERELQEKAQQQLLITAQHQLEQQQQQQQLQQALQASVANKPLHKVLQKQLEEQGKKKLPLSSPAVTPSSPTVMPSKDNNQVLSSKDTSENQTSNNLDKQAPKQGDITAASPTVKPNIPENFPAVSQTAETGVADYQQSRQNNELNNNKNVKSNGGLLSTNGGSQSTEHNGASQSSEPPKSPTASQTISQPKPQPQTPPSLPTTPQSQPASSMIKPQLPASQALTGQPLMFNPPSLPTTMTTMTQPAMIPPPKPPTLLPQVTQQLLEQQQQLQLQQQQQGVMPQFVLNETQRQTLQNLILRQQQEAQQLAQQASSLPFHQLQLTPQQQDQLFQVLSNQQISQQMLQQQQPQNLQQQQQQQQLQNLLQQQTTMTQQILNQQQQAQFLQQQQQAQLLQQQLQQIKPPVNPQKPAQRKTKNLLNIQQMNNHEQGVLGIDTATPRSPPSTPLTPNPSPASPDSISPLYAPIDLDAHTESNHDTALTLACAGGHSELVTLLLSKGADIEHRDKKGFTPLILAATAGHVDVVEILLEHGADIEAQSERTKDTPLSLACSGGRYEVVELLLSRGANKEHRNVSDYTPLSLAASGGFVNIIKLLLSHGAEINSRTGSKLGISPLMLAAMNGHTAAVKLLLDMGSDINAQIETNKNTALTLACFQGRHEVVSLLVDRKAIIEHRAKTGLTPLMEAASGGYVEVGRVLLDKGADVNAPPVPSSRDTALTIAADKGHYRFVELLLSRHAAVDVKNKKGNSPLWLACHGGHLDVVQLIVTAGADIDSQDNRKVSCLMAAFRKGHIKVVKWMVKHVNQFPSDGDLSRYIATITDKELQKKCQQCMEIIVTAKDRQAAEAYKNATNLLELLDKERQHEENKKAAAAKKREKKKKKKKEKQVKEKEEPNDSKNSTPEPESEDSQPKEQEEEEKEQLLVLEPPSATTTSTLGLTLPTSEPIYSKAKSRNNKPEKRNSKSDAQMMVVKPIENQRNSKTDAQMTIVENKLPRQDENKELKNNNNKMNAKSTESRKNKKNRRDKENDRVPDIDMSGDSRSNTGTAIMSDSVMSTGVEGHKGKKGTASNRKKKAERFGKDLPVVVGSSTTPIGDLDDFGNLPSISEKDIQKLRKSVEKTKIGHTDKGGSHYIDKSHPESNPNTLSVKTSPNLVNSPKRGQKKEDGWKEVIRKSKKVPVPASAISRVIGRGGCNINAIREVSGANIDVEKNKGSSGERIITIKGSADATRQAHALISALVSDPDKELQEILPKSKAKQQLENKSLYFIPPNDTNSTPSSNQSSGNQPSKSGNKLAPRLQAAQANAGSSRQTMGGGGVMNSPITVWGGPPTTTAASPQRSKQKHSSNPVPFSSPGMGMNGNMLDKSVTRQLFSGEQKRKGGFGSPNMITTQSNIMSGPANTKTTPSSPPSFNIRPDMRLSPGTRNQSKPLIPGSVKVLQRPNAGLQPQPLPIIQNQTTTTATTQTITSATGFNISSSSGEYSPFDNLFSNATQQLLGKKDDIMNERMNFASVAAAGVVPTFTGSPGNLGTPVSPGGPADPGLLAKAPGFKLPGPRMMNPLDMAPGFKGSGFPMSQQMMDMNMFGMNGPGPQGFQSYPQPIQSQSPNSSPRSSQSASSGMSPHSSSGFDSSQSLQREEYTTPTQPMTLPKISSSLNPNAPDFTSRTAPPGSNTGPGGPGNIPGIGILPQAMYQHALAQQLLSAFNTMGPAPNPPPGAPSPGPQNQDPLLGMGGQFNKQEFYQNMANLMHQWALQNQPPGSPGPGMGPSQGPGFTPPVPRAYSPLPAQGRPNSAPSIGGMPKDGPSGPSPTPIGPPRTNSPLPPSTPPMPDIMRLNEDRRQPRPIGGERSIRKAPGPGPLGVPGNLEFNDPLWNPSPQLNMDWSLKGTSPGLPSSMSSVMTTSVLSGGHMTTSLSANGEERVVDLENHDPSRGLEDLSEHNFSPGLQGQGLGQMPLFNGVGPYPLQEGTGFGGSGDGLPNMWNSLETPDSEDITEKGMWNWSK